MILFRNVSLSRRKVTIFIGRETKTHFTDENQRNNSSRSAHLTIIILLEQIIIQQQQPQPQPQPQPQHTTHNTTTRQHDNTTTRQHDNTTTQQHTPHNPTQHNPTQPHTTPHNTTQPHTTPHNNTQPHVDRTPSTAHFSRTYAHFHPCAHITLWLKVSHDVSA